jgi:hypothetical protein
MDKFSYEEKRHKRKYYINKIDKQIHFIEDDLVIYCTFDELIETRTLDQLTLVITNIQIDGNLFLTRPRKGD